MKVGVIGIGYWGKKHVEEYHELDTMSQFVIMMKKISLLVKKNFHSLMLKV